MRQAIDWMFFYVVACVVGDLFLTTPVAAAEMVIVQDGQPQATIVVAEDGADPSKQKIRTAAEELQAYVQKISGAKLPIVDDGQSPAGKLILVGRSRLSDAMGVDIPGGLSPARRDEGFVIICRGDRLLLAGNNDGPYHGTEYAVYDFLRSLGVRWFMPGEFGEIVPQQQTIRVPEQQVHEKPDFLMRNWWLHARPELAAEEVRWKLRNKMNPERMFAIPGDSSVRAIVAPAELREKKPGLLALNENGTRNPHLPNLSNPEAAETAGGIIKDYFRKNPTANSYGFAPDDGMPRDFNPETLKLSRGFVTLGARPGVPGEASITEEWMMFVNRVAAVVHEQFPQAYIATNGYANRNLPPEGVELDDRLVIMFAAIWSCTLHSYDDEHCWQKVRQGQMLKRWCELCPNVWIYGYNYNMLVSGLTPLPEFTKLRRDFPLMKKWGVIGFLDESRNVWAEAGIASRYLRAQLEWDADVDVDAILDDFFDKWYGPAARPMIAFYMALDEAVTQAPIHGHEDRVMPEVYTPDLLARLKRLVAEGEQLAVTDRERLHVRADRLIHDHLVAYMELAAAEAEGNFAAAVSHAEKMLSLRGKLHAINPFFIWPDEKGYHTGVWYWTITDRKNYYQSLVDKTTGKSGTLVAMAPRGAAFRTDPHEEGIFAGWQQPELDEVGWRQLDTTRPFYRQGYDDHRGHPYVGHLWYRLKLDVPATAKGKKIMLCVPVVVTEAWCWVNGTYAGHRPYQEAYVRPAQMELDVTPLVRPGQANVIAIRVDTSLSAAQAAEGIQSRVFLYATQ
ncbi:MAG: DUF4838 domain-containing protein [Planctomycetes bacterium]|nr:DUF4838 domain-containing protein [Planctomycetota bacterium]